MQSRADSAWTVLVSDLVMRSAPGVGSDSRILPETLGTGDWVYVVDGAVAMDGYDWLLVQESRVNPGAAFGWIAIGSREGEPWIEEMDVECPPEPTDESQVIALTLDQRLICFSGEPLTVTLSLPEPACGVAGGPIQAIDPDWLSGIGNYGTTGGFPGVVVEFGVAWHPDIGSKCTQPAGSYSVVGHFDDAAAETCKYRGDPPVPHPQQVTLHCRAQFVVTQLLSQP
jgi:hypothetical protein